MIRDIDTRGGGQQPIVTVFGDVSSQQRACQSTPDPPRITLTSDSVWTGTQFDAHVYVIHSDGGDKPLTCTSTSCIAFSENVSTTSRWTLAVTFSSAPMKGADSFNFLMACQILTLWLGRSVKPGVADVINRQRHLTVKYDKY